MYTILAKWNFGFYFTLKQSVLEKLNNYVDNLSSQLNFATILDTILFVLFKETAFVSFELSSHERNCNDMSAGAVLLYGAASKQSRLN